MDPHDGGHRRHHSDLGFRSPRFSDLRDFSQLADKLLHPHRHAESLRSPGARPQHWRYVPPPLCYGPPPPPPPPVSYSPDYSQIARNSVPSLEDPAHAPEVASSSPITTSQTPTAPSPDESCSESLPTPSAPPADRA
ncbi:hypothetical protein PF010_g6762 [Phytophthora fragariae]|uniref:Uncharacterized protein n=2 Tax=Phytophthora TaxID=4783 RepID=A0A6A3LDQ4_9STRA|nr:hypothetical protein PR002_g14991 [Phytophthora rubi]KAE9017531.1 hypothetical protein PF011_g6650 [Phytophthora fragariae]KAE9122349.1 hypothetical protein PF010_g6762 [Phytophthora fragariae]KAE9274970.1 hypothetical protein PR003_g29463 [Phytophthora rubi]